MCCGKSFSALDPELGSRKTKVFSCLQLLTVNGILGGVFTFWQERSRK
ncbi:hypothetical protein HMPREF9997_02617 [Corynebacterium durum F0235]|uniref:Uncharacterized protein n=1 Tax=Corynebacterium durum F0235 TaxID=1035195 RepID=L1MA35_9CORY|nr:hypothetical protein HMPREF9997_02617 [Corynebacterium durum F0235]